MYEYIRHLRKENGMTQEEVAEKLHLTPHAISQYENGKRQVTIDMMQNILSLFGYELKIEKSSITREELKEMVRSLFDLAKVYQDAFPDWETEHTGGSVFVLHRDFPALSGKPVMVKMTDEIILINTRLKKTDEDVQLVEGEFITSAEYTEDMNNEGLYIEYGWESDEPIIDVNEDLSPNELPLLRELFSEEIISKLKTDFKKIKEL